MERDSNSDTGEQAETERSVSAQSGAKRNNEWEGVEQTSAFEELVRKKKAFIIPVTIFYFVLFMSWPTLGGLTTVLDGQAAGPMTWASIYGLMLFAVVLVILHLYMSQAKKWDRLVEEARREAAEGRTEA